jgi:SAM-dependent methyltransferase
MLTVLLGDYCSGKTFMAKYFARELGGIYLDVDVLSLNKGDQHNGTLISRLKDVIQSDKDYYLDGWNNYNYYNKLSQLLNIPVKYMVCMAAPYRIAKSQDKRKNIVADNLPKSPELVADTLYGTASVALTYDPNPVFIDTTSFPPTFWNKSNWLNRWGELQLYSDIINLKAYQDIELTDRTVVGLSQSYKTWERLNCLVYFKDKSVVDYGCNYGYFSFKAERAGASSVIGIDTQGVLTLTRRIAWVKHSNILFRPADLLNYVPPDSDIILALNVLHHLNYDRQVLNNMFNHGSTIVIECPVKDKMIIDIIADKYQFREPIVSNSHREDRCILIYSKNKIINVPGKFAYHPRREAIKKLINHIVFQGIWPYTVGAGYKVLRGILKR